MCVWGGGLRALPLPIGGPCGVKTSETCHIIEKEWRLAEVHLLAFEYLQMADGEYGIERLNRWIDIGSHIAKGAGSFRNARRRAQEIKMREIRQMGGKLTEKAYLSPSLAAEILDAMRIG